MARIIDNSKDIYPYCIVWSPLQPITTFLPFIGHTGIADSRGVIYDFAGPYQIGTGRMAFGSPTRYIQLDPKLCDDLNWDEALHQGCDIYSQRMHNILFDNCHSHVAKCLNIMGYAGKRSRTMIDIGVWFFFLGRFPTIGDVVKTYLPSLVLIAIIIVLSSIFG